MPPGLSAKICTASTMKLPTFLAGFGMCNASRAYALGLVCGAPRPGGDWPVRVDFDVPRGALQPATSMARLLFCIFAADESNVVTTLRHITAHPSSASGSTLSIRCIASIQRDSPSFWRVDLSTLRFEFGQRGSTRCLSVVIFSFESSACPIFRCKAE
jgi:hypothetical protein